jgi:hypothetical protein
LAGNRRPSISSGVVILFEQRIRRLRPKIMMDFFLSKIQLQP